MSYIGNSPTFLLKGSKAVFEYTATAGQTAFTGGDDNSAVLKALDDTISVYSNGVRLVLTDDYTLNTAGDTVTLTSAAALNDIIVIETFDEIANLGTYTKAEADARYINTSGDITTGTIQVSGSGNNIELGDNNKVTFGGTDLEIYSNGTTGQLAGNITVTGDIIAQSSLQIFRQAAGAASVLLQRSGAAGPWSLAQGNTSTNYFEILEGSNTRLTIKDGGNVGIGTDNPARPLNIVNDAGSNPIQSIRNSSLAWSQYALTRYGTEGEDARYMDFGYYRGSNEPTRGLVIKSQVNATLVTFLDSGNVGIGTQTPAHKLDVAGTTKAEQYLLDAVAKDISDTAVDVFIYDTRKDSDGGAWRKRTQNTSWYNETLNTATRGARKEFPAVAVIVAESNQVTIYDGDDPDMPMWMVFNADTSGKMLLGHASQAPISSIAFKNGILSAGASSSSVGGLTTINFVCDKAYMRRTGSSTYILNTGISGRESSSHGVDTSIGGIVNVAVNDVAMTVLPNAPIDSATELPVPTIAVATNGGVSVIKDDGTVVDIVSDTIQHEMPREVKFVDDKVFWVAGNNYDNAWSSVNSTKIPTGDITTPYYSVTTANALVSKYTPKEWNVTNHVGDLLIPINMQSPRTDALIAVAKDNELIIGGKGSDDQGTVVKVEENLSDPESGMITQIASDFATGYQVGDIKLATLSDTDDTNVTGTELVTNGTFDSNTTGWTEQSGGGASISVVSGELQITGGTASYPRARQEFTTVVGQRYGVSVTARKGTASNNVYIYNNDLGASNITYHTSTTNAKLSFAFTASSTTSYVELTINGVNNGTTAFFDNVSIRLLTEEDRSVNGNDLQVFGTVTKSAVATGADLVAYSGFSSTNYLEQPYNSDLDFGTGDFSVMGWVKPNSISGSDIILNRNNFGVSGFEVYINNSVGLGLSTAGQYFQQGSALPDNTWSFFCIKRVGTTAYMYINGEQVNSVSNGANLSVNLPLMIGNDASKNNPFSGSLALIRISGTAPSPEQIKKIYEDEKFLFQENAKATLYGTSDAVTALAYDDDTELLHAGTSAGRSVFQGLRRIDNTTDAVGTAISASNGMVAED